MKLLHLLLPSIALATPLNARCTAPQSLANETNTYDYIVTGSGPGGGTIATNLARAGYSVLLLEAGDDESKDIRTQVLSLNNYTNPSVAWHFFVRHSDDEEREKRYNLMVWRLTNGEYWVGRDPTVDGHQNATRLGIFYPRGSTLGGSAIINAAVTLLPSDSDWDYFNKGVGDGIWSGKEMRRIFERIEHNNYLEPNTTGHGFTSWLQTNVADAAVYAAGALRLKPVQAALKLIGWNPDAVVDYITADGNYLSPTRDQTAGLWGTPFHATSNWKRFSPRDYVLETLNVTTANGTQQYPLRLQLNSLATKVLFDECGGNGTKPQAVGVEYLQGKSIYRADARYNPTNKGVLNQAFARKEVIVAGGAFSSPQLLQLSGIGPKALLRKLSIPVISDLPGVGRNLQDNYELPIAGRAQIDIRDPPALNAPPCTNGAPGDPCVDMWREGKGPYAKGGSNSHVFLLKTNHAVEGERDMLMFTSGTRVVRGFKPDTKQNTTADPPTTFSWSTVKIHPQNGAGYIQIKSTDPQDTPDINLNYFAEGAETDLGSILDTIAFVRKAYRNTEAPVGPIEPFTPPCPAADILETGYCKDGEIDRQWAQDQAFGHHPTSTNRVGPDSNPLSVLDTRLRVRGVERLRVVDASAFPRCPGAFPAVATFMLSEKATELVLADAKSL
ncbi:alcohol oxidase [Ophiobolus disseminans]|uniref:Alcohol oxidase n=1 Tax=Ophiobolus disseminans TaxID=1469910 RepID=A0A6A7AG76_9PLEO|nr:alcohol oxidase [Ophiobolus disseminans]